MMFCTGGIRCEKAGPYMEREGFEQVFQLDGGILKYFEDCGGEHYSGDCFVFDGASGSTPVWRKRRTHNVSIAWSHSRSLIKRTLAIHFGRVLPALLCARSRTQERAIAERALAIA